MSPLRTYVTQADFDTGWRFNAEPDGHPADREPVMVGYVRGAVMATFLPWACPRVVNALGWTATSRVVIVGGGFGWSVEVYRGLLPGARIIALDTSPWVHEAKGANDDEAIDAAIRAAGLLPGAGRGAEIRARLSDGGPRSRLGGDLANEDMATAASRGRVRALLGGAATFEVHTESVLESLTDAEALVLSQRAHQATSGRVSHLVTTTREGVHEGYNWKTLAEWKALLPADTFVELGVSGDATFSRFRVA